MRLRATVALTIGVIAGLVGIMTLVFGAFDSLLPVNRLLGATIASLLVMWALLCAAQAWEQQ